MKRLLLPLLLAACAGAHAQSFLPGYNTAFYANTLSAAKGIAQPFLLRQGYTTLSGVTVTDSTLHYGGVNYIVHQTYQNGGAGYKIAASQYGAYGITGISNVWPNGLPNVLYNPDSAAWFCIGDCVSYLMRVLSAAGDTTVANNAYLNLQSIVKAANTTPIASRGISSTAYELGCAFPTLGIGNPAGWQYIAGNVLWDSVDATNHYYRSTIGAYNGVAKGGFAAARAGDVLAYSFPRTASYNGHLMILESGPQLLNSDSLKTYMPTQSAANIAALLAKYKVYAVPVFDCSGKKAHFRDSRQTVSGVGHGTILILTSLSADVPKGFIFGAGSVSGSSINYDTVGVDVFALSVGRWKGGTATSVVQSSLPQLRIASNPVSGMLRIHADAGGRATIFNAAGIIVQRLTLSPYGEATADVSTLPAGTYFIMLRTEDGEVSRAFLKL